MTIRPFFICSRKAQWAKIRNKVQFREKKHCMSQKTKSTLKKIFFNGEVPKGEMVFFLPGGD